MRVCYSGTSDKGPSEIGTTSLYKGQLLRHHANALVYYFTSEIGTASLQGTKFVSPKVSLVRRFHCSSSKLSYKPKFVFFVSLAG